MIVSLSGRSCRRSMYRFSLIELLVVILIIGILMALGVGGYNIAQKKLAETRTRATLEKIKLALEAYKVKHGYYIQEYGDTAKDAVGNVITDKDGNDYYYFHLDRVVAGQDNLSKIISYKDTPNYDSANTSSKKSNPDYNAFVLDSYSGTKDDVKRRIIYICPATDAPFELRSSGHDRIFGKENGTAAEKKAAQDDIVVK